MSAFWDDLARDLDATEFQEEYERWLTEVWMWDDSECGEPE